MSRTFNTDSSGRRGGPLRRTVECLVLLAIAGAIVSEFLLEGWLVPIVVSSGSMATTLLGPHCKARCPDCGMEFVYDAAPPDDGRPPSDPTSRPIATCPNCGRRGIEAASVAIAGDRIIIDRGTFAIREPARWEVALFRCPELASDYCVKRIVGLPGEKVEIRDGDVFVDGKIARKTLAQQRAMAVLVHDSNWQAADGHLPSRWTSNAVDGWTASKGGWWTVGNSSPGGGPAWLDYLHWRRALGASTAVHESPIYDEDGYNPTTSRQLTAVADLLLVCRLSATGEGTLLLKAHDGNETLMVAITPATGAVTLARGDRAPQSVQATTGALGRPVELSLSLIDRQVILAIDSRAVLVQPLESNSASPPPSSNPFSIGAQSLDVRIERLQIWRDVYYTPPPRPQNAIVHLGPDEYFVLGDNSPISHDSRSWTGGQTMLARLLVGRPLVAIRRDDKP